MWNIFGSKPKSNLPEPTPLQAQRTKQIDQLKSFNQNVSEIQRDLEYRVNTVVNGVSLALNITLPPRFPQDKPMVKISPAVSHPWVDDQMIVTGSPGINNFVVHSDLGKVIKEVVEELNRNPPTLLSQQQQQQQYNPRFAPYPQVQSTSAGPSAGSRLDLGSMTHMPLPPTLSSASGSLYNGDAHYPHLPAGPVGSYRLPDIPASFPGIQDLSKEQLQELLDNEDQLIEMISNLGEVQQISKDRQQLCDENTQAAKDNLSKKPILEDKKRILLEKYDQLNELREQFDKNCQTQDTLREAYNLRALEDNLKVAALQAEEEAEGIAEKFLDGKLSVEEFKKQYSQTRTLGHLRRAKEEKLAKMSSTQNQAGF